jgi:hypothetical protein
VLITVAATVGAATGAMVATRAEVVTKDTDVEVADDADNDAKVVKEERDLVRLVDVGFFRPNLDLVAARAGAGAGAGAGEATVETLVVAGILDAPPDDSLRVLRSDVGRTGALRLDRVFSNVLNTCSESGPNDLMPSTKRVA